MLVIEKVQCPTDCVSMHYGACVFPQMGQAEQKLMSVSTGVQLKS